MASKPINIRWIRTGSNYFLVAKLLYNSKCPSVRQSRSGGNVIFSAPIKDRRLKFSGIKYVRKRLNELFSVGLRVAFFSRAKSAEDAERWWPSAI